MKLILGLLLGLLLSGPLAFGATVTGGNCTYSLIQTDSFGNLTVSCVGAPIPPVEPPIVPPVTPPVNPPAGCNSNAIQSLTWGQVRVFTSPSGAVMAFQTQVPQTWHSSIELTQGQTTVTPPHPTTRFSVSQCPGSMDNVNPLCVFGPTITVPYNVFDIYTKDMGIPNSCVINPALGNWYVNVQWTYSSCPFGGGCGFSMQWADGPW